MRKSKDRSGRAAVCAPAESARIPFRAEDGGRVPPGAPGGPYGEVRAAGRGGRPPVTVYGNARQPLRGGVRQNVFRRPAYTGRRDGGNDSLSAWAGRRQKFPAPLRDAADPANDVMNSAVADFGRDAARRPAYHATTGFDSEVFGPGPAVRSGGHRLTFRFTTRAEGYRLGALFVQTDTGS